MAALILTPQFASPHYNPAALIFTAIEMDQHIAYGIAGRVKVSLSSLPLLLEICIPQSRPSRCGSSQCSGLEIRILGNPGGHAAMLNELYAFGTQLPPVETERRRLEAEVKAGWDLRPVGSSPLHPHLLPATKDRVSHLRPIGGYLTIIPSSAPKERCLLGFSLQTGW